MTTYWEITVSVVECHVDAWLCVDGIVIINYIGLYVALHMVVQLMYILSCGFFRESPSE